MIQYIIPSVKENLCNTYKKSSLNLWKGDTTIHTTTSTEDRKNVFKNLIIWTKKTVFCDSHNFF